MRGRRGGIVLLVDVHGFSFFATPFRDRVVLSESMVTEMFRVDAYVMSWSSPIRLARRVSLRAVRGPGR